MLRPCRFETAHLDDFGPICKLRKLPQFRALFGTLLCRICFFSAEVAPVNRGLFESIGSARLGTLCAGGFLFSTGDGPQWLIPEGGLEPPTSQLVVDCKEQMRQTFFVSSFLTSNLYGTCAPTKDMSFCCTFGFGWFCTGLQPFILPMRFPSLLRPADENSTCSLGTFQPTAPAQNFHVRWHGTFCDHFLSWIWARGSSNSGGLLYIFTSSHLHIFLFHIYTGHLHIFASSSSHLHTFTCAHLHTSSLFLSSHLPIFTSSLLPALSLSLARSLPSVTLSLRLFLFSLFRPRGVPTRHLEMATLSHEMKFGCKKNCDFEVSAATILHEMRLDRRKIAI